MMKILDERETQKKPQKDKQRRKRAKRTEAVVKG